MPRDRPPAASTAICVPKAGTGVQGWRRDTHVPCRSPHSHHAITHTHVPATRPCSPLLAPVTITVLPLRSVEHLRGSQGLLRMAQSSSPMSRSSRSHHGGLRVPSSSMAGRGVGPGTEVTAGPLPGRQRGTARVPLLRELLGAEEGQQSGWSRQEGEPHVPCATPLSPVPPCQLVTVTTFAVVPLTSSAA